MNTKNNKNVKSKNLGHQSKSKKQPINSIDKQMEQLALVLIDIYLLNQLNLKNEKL
ncbi:MAG: hypothetical protein RIQ61_515 [Bacteroidota bacterium]|jgi:hypothetical protein